MASWVGHRVLGEEVVWEFFCSCLAQYIGLRSQFGRGARDPRWSQSHYPLETHAIVAEILELRQYEKTREEEGKKNRGLTPDGEFVIYKVYRERWFGLAGLMLMNSVIS